MEGLEKERDFYFEKLRDIECMLQDLVDNGKGNELTESIFKILYATAEGFEQVEEVVENAPEPCSSEEIDGEILSAPEAEEIETF
jgi:RP/EB family microtubule-associated protein